MRTKIEEILTEGGGGRIYRAILERIDTYREPHAFIEEGYRLYPEVYKELEKKKPTKTSKNNSSKEATPRSTNGQILEYLICETLAIKGILPLYYQAKFTLVPDAVFDIVLYHPSRPIVLSAKVSLRERYKQADSEGKALKQVYRKAKSHLITLDDKDITATQKKIEDRDIEGLESCVRADQPAYDELLDEIAKQDFEIAKEIMPIESQSLLKGTAT